MSIPAYIPTISISAQCSAAKLDGHLCSRRALLRTAAAALVGVRMLPSRAGIDVAEMERMDAMGKASGEETLAEFTRRLENGDVRFVWFYGSFLDTCVFLDGTGSYRRVGEGYPTESPRSPESPKQVVAKVREWGVPYYLGSPVDRRFLRVGG